MSQNAITKVEFLTVSIHLRGKTRSAVLLVYSLSQIPQISTDVGILKKSVRICEISENYLFFTRSVAPCC